MVKPNPNITLKLRKGSEKWQAHIRTQNGILHRISTGKTDREEAEAWAANELFEMNYRLKHNQVARTKTVRDAALQHLKEIGHLTPEGQGHHKLIVNKWIIPFIGKIDIDRLTTADIAEWHKKKDEGRKKPLVWNTISKHNQCLLDVMNTALKHQWITADKIPKMENTALKGLRRPDFSQEEIVMLLSRLWDSSLNHRRRSARENHRLFFYYVTFLHMTGIRPGVEVDSIRWSDISEESQDGIRYLKIIVRFGKTIKYKSTGERIVVAPIELKEILDEFVQWRGDIPGDNDYIFRRRDGAKVDTSNFTHALRVVGMLMDNSNPPRRRSLYSIRHTYATSHVSKGEMTDLELAYHMGTSVRMLEQHYAHIRAENIAAKVISNRQIITSQWTVDIVKAKESTRKEPKRKPRPSTAKPKTPPID